MKLLLVDDDPDMLLIVAAVLRRRGGIDTIRLDDPLQVRAVAALERPDAILMDVLMDPIDGPEVLTQLAADLQTRDIPVIFLTGTTEPDEILRLLGLGAKGVITKPINPATLVHQLQGLLSETVSLIPPVKSDG